MEKITTPGIYWVLTLGQAPHPVFYEPCRICSTEQGGSIGPNMLPFCGENNEA